MLDIKTFPVKMTEAFNAELKIAAIKAGTTMHDYIMEAVSEKMAKDKKKAVK